MAVLALDMGVWAKLVFCLILDRSRGAATVAVGMGWLTSILKVSRPTVRRALDEIRAAGLLRSSQPANGKRTVYEIPPQHQTSNAILPAGERPVTSNGTIPVTGLDMALVTERHQSPVTKIDGGGNGALPEPVTERYTVQTQTPNQTTADSRAAVLFQSELQAAGVNLTHDQIQRMVAKGVTIDRVRTAIKNVAIRKTNGNPVDTEAAYIVTAIDGDYAPVKPTVKGKPDTRHRCEDCSTLIEYHWVETWEFPERNGKPCSDTAYVAMQNVFNCPACRPFKPPARLDTKNPPTREPIKRELLGIRPASDA